MVLTDWFRKLFNKHGGSIELDAYCRDIATDIFFKELAVQSCINLIAAAIAQSEFITFDKGNETKGSNYYLFNIEPNQNYNSAEFWAKVISKMVYENEALVVQTNNMFYVADSWNIEKYALKENVYKNVVVDSYELSDTFYENQVLRFKLHDSRISMIVNGIYESYGSLIAYSRDNYKRSNAKRGVLDVPTSYPQTPKHQQELQDLLGNKFKKFFEAEGGAVVPLTNGIKYTDLSSTGYKGSIDSRDIRQLVDDIFDFVAMGFQIPPQLLKGTVADTDGVVNTFLTFRVNHIADIITTEINRKYYKKEAYLQKSYVKLDTTRIKVLSIKEMASSLDILFRSAVNTINDNLRMIGREPINEEWANEHFITKNYQSVEEFKGGLNSEN